MPRMHKHTRRPLRVRLAAFAFAVAVTLGVASVSMADSIKMGDLWLDGVTIQKIEKGVIFYTSRAGADEERDFIKVQGIKLASHPELETALTAIQASTTSKDQAVAAAKDTEALAALNKVITSARFPWIKQYAQAHAIHILDRQGKLTECVEALLALARDGGEEAYFLKAPVVTARVATAAQRKDALARLEPAQGKLTGAAQTAVKRIVEILKEPAPNETPVTTPTPPAGGSTGSTTPTPPPAGGTPTTTGTQTPAMPAKTGPRRGPAMTKHLSETDPISILLQDGKYDEALAAADKELNTNSRELGMRLYQKGLAQLALADKTNDEKRYKDAGLSFARVVTYYGNRKSNYEGPALVELGYVHLKINRRDIALKMFDRAINYVTEEDPAVFERLESLRETFKRENGEGEAPKP